MLLCCYEFSSNRLSISDFQLYRKPYVVTIRYLRPLPNLSLKSTRSKVVGLYWHLLDPSNDASRFGFYFVLRREGSNSPLCLCTSLLTYRCGEWYIASLQMLPRIIVCVLVVIRFLSNLIFFRSSSTVLAPYPPGAFPLQYQYNT